MEAMRTHAGISALWKKYRLAVLVVLTGVVLMLLPGGGEDTVSDAPQDEVFSLERTEERMAETLRSIEGTGQLRLMLTLRRTSRLELAKDTDRDQRAGETRQQQSPITLRRSSGSEDVVVTEQEYPVYQGAVVVTEGADDPQVCLSLTEAVCALTGLPSDRVTVVKWKS